MHASFLDARLREWESYVTTAAGGMPVPGRIVFRCLSDPSERPRVLEVDGNRAHAERLLTRASDDELREFFEASGPIS